MYKIAFPYKNTYILSHYYYNVPKIIMKRVNRFKNLNQHHTQTLTLNFFTQTLLL